VRCGGRIADDSYLWLTYRGFEGLVVEALRELRAEKDAEIEAIRTANDAEVNILREGVAELRRLVNDLARR
jgi:hypothetical protein